MDPAPPLIAFKRLRNKPDCPMPAAVKFLIVTPSFNAPQFLDQTIASIVGQHGDFAVHYHIQDGGSGAATLDVIRAWEQRLSHSGTTDPTRKHLAFSWAVEPDRSMYDAIQKGFDRLLATVPRDPDDRIILSWLNTDDLFTPNAFLTVARFLTDHHEESWVTGLPCLIREDGCIADLRLEDCGYARARLACGEYDGRRLPPVMQEGTFWTLDLWQRVGGLDISLRLAGDWDLWRRMAEHARLINLRAVLAYHRRRSGQLSSDMSEYWAELDAVKRRIGDARPTLAGERIALEGAWMGAWRTNLGRWVLSPMRYRRDGFLHCLSDCLVESWSKHAVGRAIIKGYRRLRGVVVE